MDKEHPSLPAPLIEHECINCGAHYLDDCHRVDLVEDDIEPRSVPMEYSRAIVFASAGLSVSLSLYKVVDASFWLLQHGQLLPFDFNVVITAVGTGFGLLGGYLWAKEKEGKKDDNDSR